MKLTGQKLKEIMFKYNISNVELGHYADYDKRYISGLRSGRYPITDGFKSRLMDYLIKKKKVDIIEAARLVGFGGSYE